MIVGLDEAGVGAAYGSLWAAAVYLQRDDVVDGITDSKKLSKRKREAIAVALKAAEADVMYGLGEVTQMEIDTNGMGEARRLVFHRALDDFLKRNGEKLPEKLIVDGTLFRDWRGVPFECLPGADAKIACVGAASILAKTTRDAQVKQMCDNDTHAKYGIRKNMGYLSKEHLNGLKTHGWGPHHRRSYKIRSIPDL